MPHRELLQAVWGPDYGDEAEYLRVFINQLRKKLEPDPAHPKYILTEPWVGYRFARPHKTILTTSLRLPYGSTAILDTGWCHGNIAQKTVAGAAASGREETEIVIPDTHPAVTAQGAGNGRRAGAGLDARITLICVASFPGPRPWCARPRFRSNSPAAWRSMPLRCTFV